MTRLCQVLFVIGLFIAVVHSAPTPDQPWMDLDPNGIDLTEQSGPVFGPMMGFLRRTRHAYGDYVQSAAHAIRKMVYAPWQRMMKH